MHFIKELYKAFSVDVSILKTGKVCLQESHKLLLIVEFSLDLYDL